MMSGRRIVPSPNRESADIDLLVSSREGYRGLRELVMRGDEELLEVRNFGETTLREVKSKLAERGLHLGMKLPAAARR